MPLQTAFSAPRPLSIALLVALTWAGLATLPDKPLARTAATEVAR